jgi:hypothetical protein
VINVAFDVGKPLHDISLWDYQCRFDHYRPVIEFGAARFARSAGEMAEHVNAYLDNPDLDREGRRRLVELQVGAPLGESTGRILRTLKRIASGETKSASTIAGRA